jgi:membrane protein YqaA with SNARE-associated domain
LEDLSLVGLFVVSFLSASVLPGSSELVFITMLINKIAPDSTILWVATAGNTLGGVTTFFVGRFISSSRLPNERVLLWTEKWGGFSLLFSWVPFLGDVICITAGWLRTGVILSLLCLSTGKLIRYWVLMAGIT